MIDYDNKFIFIHIPKNAGSSINRVIKYSNGKAKQLGNTHITAGHAKSELGECWDEYFTFSVVRNPWDRLFSMYKFRKKRQRDISPFDQWIEEDHFTVASYAGHPVISIKKKPQVDWICDSNGDLLINYIARFENLSADFKELSKRCKLKGGLGKINVSPGESYKYAYDETSYAFVEKYFTKDIAMFDYKF